MTHYKRTRAQIEAGEGNEYMAELGRFNRTKATAKLRGLLWAIEFADWKLLTGLPCIYGGKGLADGIRISLDRLDNDKGYTSENVVPSCWFHNWQRSCNWTHEAFLDIMAHYPTECRNRQGKTYTNPFESST